MDVSFQIVRGNVQQTQMRDLTMYGAFGQQAQAWGQQQPAAGAWCQQAQQAAAPTQQAGGQNKDVTLIVTGCTHGTERQQYYEAERATCSKMLSRVTKARAPKKSGAGEDDELERKAESRHFTRREIQRHQSRHDPTSETSTVVHSQGRSISRSGSSIPQSEWPWGSLPGVTSATSLPAVHERPPPTKATMAAVMSGPKLATWGSETQGPLRSRLRKQVGGSDLPVTSHSVVGAGDLPDLSHRVKPVGDISQAPSGVHGDSHADPYGDRQEQQGPGYRKKRSKEPRELFGVSKIWWAMVANILALLAFIACIPCVLTIAKRRRAS